jgi:hypothetical protein
MTRNVDIFWPVLCMGIGFALMAVAYFMKEYERW